MSQGSKPLTTLLEQIREDKRAHGGDWTRPGFQAVAVHRFGVWANEQPSWLRGPFVVLADLMFCFVRNFYSIELPFTVKLGRRVIIEHQGCIVIHGSVEIGDDCIIRQGVTLGNRYLDYDRLFDAPKLGHRVNVGAGAKILGAVTIGDDVSIGANSVVLSDIPAGQTAVGIPAKLILSAVV